MNHYISGWATPHPRQQSDWIKSGALEGQEVAPLAEIFGVVVTWGPNPEEKCIH
jgi:hypothetical protein